MDIVFAFNDGSVITVSYTGAVVIFCLFQAANMATLAWVDYRLSKKIENAKEQSMVDMRAIAALVKK